MRSTHHRSLREVGSGTKRAGNLSETGGQTTVSGSKNKFLARKRQKEKNQITI